MGESEKGSGWKWKFGKRKWKWQINPPPKHIHSHSKQIQQLLPHFHNVDKFTQYSSRFHPPRGCFWWCGEKIFILRNLWWQISIYKFLDSFNTCFWSCSSDHGKRYFQTLDIPSSPWLVPRFKRLTRQTSWGKNFLVMMIAFITFNSSLGPLIEALCRSNAWEFEFSVFRRNRTDDLTINSPSLWPTEPRLHVRSWKVLSVSLF